MLAAEKGHHRVCDLLCYLLMRRGVKIDLVDNNGKTALMLAAEKGHHRVCNLLIRRGAKIDLADKDRKTALMLAVESGYDEVYRLLKGEGTVINRYSKKALLRPSPISISDRRSATESSPLARNSSVSEVKKSPT